MTKDEALRLALEAMKINNKAWKLLADSGDAGNWEAEEQGYYQLNEQAITAIKEALETKDEPVAWEQFYPDIGKPQIAFNTGRVEYVAPQRTWVGLTELDCVGWFGYDTGLRLWFETNKGDDGAIPLYKDQQQRTWVGLTDEEIQECLQGLPTQTIDVYARRIEIKIKDKNT